MEASRDLLVYNIMFDVDLFVNKEYSAHTHCSLLCLNNKCMLVLGSLLELNSL